MPNRKQHSKWLFSVGILFVLAGSWNAIYRSSEIDNSISSLESIKKLEPVELFQAFRNTHSILSLVKNYHVEKTKSDVWMTNPDQIERKICRSLNVSIDPSMLQMKKQQDPSEFLVKRLVEIGAVYAEKNSVSLEDAMPYVMNGLLANLDPHSRFLDKMETNDLRETAQGQFGGIGVIVGIKKNILTVLKTLEGSPAERAGIKPMDKIYGINGRNTFDLSLDEVVNTMRGSPNSTARMMVYNPKRKSIPVEFKMNREVIALKSAYYKNISNSTLSHAYIRVEAFSRETSQEVREILAHHKRANGKIDSVILDLRGNPGGLLDQAAELSNVFLDDGLIVSTEGYEEESYYASSGGTYKELNIAVLLDGQSASASEIVAAALQDHKRALILGERSFGKGSVQTLFELPDETSLKLTIARYFTPAGRSIQNKGVNPDIRFQPVFMRGKNDHLFGAQHLFSESVLYNSLSNDSRLKLAPRTLKTFYYKVNTGTDNAQVTMPPGPNDKIVKFAKILQSNCSFGKVVDAESIRGISECAESQEVITRSNKLASEWLESRYGLRWEKNQKDQPKESSLELTYNTEFDTLKGLLRVNWSIRNTGEHNVDRVSCFGVLGTDSIQSFETLVGTIAPGEIKSGHQEFLKYPHAPKRESGLIGLSQDAVTDFSSIKALETSWDPVVYQPLKISVKQKSMNADSSEKSYTVRVLNPNNYDLKHIKLELSNLSGELIGLSHSRFSTPKIKALEVREFNFVVKLNSNQWPLTPRQFGVAAITDFDVFNEKTVFDVDMTTKMTRAH